MRPTRLTGATALAILLGAGLAPVAGDAPAQRTSAKASTAANGPAQPATAAAERAAFERAFRSVSFTRGGGASGVGGHKSLEGWTNRRYQRAARKARNVRRNRAAHR